MIGAGLNVNERLIAAGIDIFTYLITQYGMTAHCSAQHSTAQHSTAQHSTAQHSTAQHSTANQQLALAISWCCVFAWAHASTEVMVLNGAGFCQTFLQRALEGSENVAYFVRN